MTDPTWSEVKRAIYEADMNMDRLYREINHQGKTYGAFCYVPGLPLNIVTSVDICQLFHKCFMTGDGKLFMFIECWLPGVVHYPVEFVTESDTGETWSGKAIFRLHLYNYRLSKYFHYPFAWFYVDYRPDPNNPKRMKLTVRKDGWDTDATGDLYLLDNLLIHDLKTTPDGTEVTMFTEEFKGFPRNIYSLQYATIPAMYYYWHNRPTKRNLALKMAALLDDYGIIGYATNNVAFAIEEEVQADIFCNPQIFGFDPDFNRNVLPRGLGYFTDVVDGDYGICREHYAGLHIPTTTACAACIYKGCHAGTCWARHSWLDNAALRAIWAMRKLKDPKAKDDKGISAEDYLINGWTDGCGVSAPGLITYWQEGKGFWISKGEVYSTLHGWALMAFTMLGYGFEYEDAKIVADDLASIAIKTQWGYPWTGEYVGTVGCKGPWQAPDGTIHIINRPDLRGSFANHFIWVDDIAVKRNLKIGEAEREKEEFFKWNWPPDVPFYTHGGFNESTLPTAQALRIYEYYKWRVRL